MVGKKYVCKADSRSFKTAAGLAQHQRDSHGSGQTRLTTQRVPKVRRQQPMAIVATGETVRGAQSDAARMSGVDRIFHGPVILGMRSETVVCDLLITPGLFRRLAVVSKAYQKIRYLRLRFRVEPQVSTTTSGGYVVAFVADPSDDVTDINALTSQQGSVTTKWWQGSSVSCTSRDRAYYTSNSVEVREYSPGRLVVMVDGPATQAGSVTIFAEWSVELSGPSLETSLSKDIVATADWWSRDGHIGLFSRANKGFNGDVRSMIADFKVGDYYRVEADVVYPSPTKGQYNTLTWVYVKSVSDLIPCWGDRDEQDDTALTQTSFVLREGTVLRRYRETAVSGEAMPLSSYVLPTTTADSQNLYELCGKLLRLLSISSGRSVVSLDDYLLPADPSDCVERSS